MEITARNGLIALQSIATKLLCPLPTLFILAASITIMAATMSVYDLYIYLFGGANPRQLSFQIFLILYSILCCAPTVIFINKYIFKNPIANIGLQMPRSTRSTYFLILLSLAYTIQMFAYLLNQPSMHQYYSYGPCSIYRFIGMQLLLFPAYYFAEELFFRGFLFLSLWDRIGWHSFWISDFLFTAAHLGKPPLEIALCIPMSILLNFMTLRTRSVYPAFFVHTVLGIFTFTLVNINSVHW